MSVACRCRAAPSLMPAAEPIQPRILAVDDDALVLATLESLFGLETEYSVSVHSDPKEAITELERKPVDLIISDFLMPTMNGIDFLAQARRLQPDAARILLTGFADKQNAIRAINEAGIYHYLEKPWDNDHLLLLIRNALEESSLRRLLGDKIQEFERLTRQHTDLSDRHRSLELELEMAARVQQSLLPTNIPDIEGYRINAVYRPSEAVGGDFYDVHLRNGNAVWLVCDVSGHGVQASLTSMLLKAIFQQAAARIDDMPELLRTMNAELHRYLPSGMYAVAAVFLIDAEDGSLSIANAGLPHPFLLSGKPGKPVEQIPMAGLPLGLFPASTTNDYDSRRFQLSPGERMLVCSDGLGEIRNGEDDLFENRALGETLASLGGKPTQQVLSELVEQALAFGGSRALADDLTILAVDKL